MKKQGKQFLNFKPLAVSPTRRQLLLSGLAVALFGITKKGAQRWVNVGVVIQPSELLKIATPLMLAWWFQRREGQLSAPDFGVAALLLAVPVGLIMKQPDLGTAILVLSGGLYVIFFAGLSWKLILPVLLRSWARAVSGPRSRAASPGWRWGWAFARASPSSRWPC